MINFLLAGTFLSAAFPSIPSSLWILLFIVIITCINVFGIQMTAKVNGILVLFQFLVTALFVILSIKKMIEGESDLLFFSSLQLFDSEASFSFVLAGASILCLSFLGFDAVTTLSEETVDQEKCTKGYFSCSIYRRNTFYTRFVHYPACLPKLPFI